MNKYINYGWLILIAVTLGVGFYSYVNTENNPKIQTETKYSQEEMEQAIIYFNESKEYDKALVLAKEYVALYPEDMNGWVHRGFAYMNLGNCIEASTDFYHGSVNGNELAGKLLAEIKDTEICKKELTNQN